MSITNLPHHTNTTHTHTRLTTLCLLTSRVSRYQKRKPICILLKQETVSGSGIHWAICKSAPRSRRITMPAPHCSVFYRPDALPATKPTVSKHWRQYHTNTTTTLYLFSGLFSRTTWVCRYQKSKISLGLNEARDNGVWDGSGISRTICKQSAPCSSQITTPTVQHLIA